MTVTGYTPTLHESKAYSFRSYVSALDSLGYLKEIRDYVSQPTRHLMDHLPPSSAWIDGQRLLELEEAVFVLKGPIIARQVGRSMVNSDTLTILNPLIKGLLRLFGASPHTLFSKLPSITESNSRGWEFHYSKVSDRSCEMRCTALRDPKVSISAFYCIAGSLEAVFGICGTTGTVRDPVRTNTATSTTGIIRISW